MLLVSPHQLHIDGHWTWPAEFIQSHMLPTGHPSHSNVNYSSIIGHYISNVCFRTTFCSYPDQVCVYQLNSTAALPQTTVGLENQLRTSPAGSLSCSGNTLVFRGLSYPDLGMTYDARAQLVIPNHQGTNFCDSSTGKLVIPSSTATSLQLLIAADTSFDDTKGNAANSFSFRGVDPAAKVSSTVSAAAKKSFSSLLSAHVDDFTSYSGRFTLNLPDTMGSSNKETSALISGYSVDNGDPYVESLLFDLGRYLFMSSARSNSLPAGLQGRWTEQLSPSWGADFHADINLQMYFRSLYFILIYTSQRRRHSLTVIGIIGLSTRPV